MKIKRRTFVRQTAEAGLALGSLAALGVVPARSEEGGPSPEDRMLPIVDTHQHLWDLKKLRLPWLKPGGELTRNFVMEDYFEATKGLNVVKAVYMEVAAATEDLVKEAEYVLGLCRRTDNPTCAAVIGGRPAADDFKHYINRYKDNPYIKGIRQIPRSAELLGDEKLIPGIRLLGELGMSFDLCVSPGLLADGAKLVDRCGDTRFILDHCGNADPNAFRNDADEKSRRTAQQWKRDIAALAERKNIVCKISGIVARMTKGKWTPDDLAPVINHCLEVFGPDRVMFASDWPVCTRGATLRGWVEALKEIVRDRSKEHQRKLFHDNAVAFYGLA